MIIKDKLLNYNNRFNKLIEAIDHPGADKESISEQYKILKNEIGLEIKVLRKLTSNAENQDEIESVYLPALKDVHDEMKVKTNGPVNKKMQLCLSSAQDYITYYLSMMK